MKAAESGRGVWRSVPPIHSAHRCDANRILSIGFGITLGILFIVTGNVMGKLRWNYSVGIRTPWTLANERVWDQTPRFDGKVFVVGGFVMAASSLLPSMRPFQGAVAVIVIALLVALPVLKSYLLWRGQNNESV